MSRSSVVGLMTAISSILLITLGLGQACSSGFDANLGGAKVPGTSIFVGVGSNGNGGGYSGMESNGNGGGYSGLQSVSQGPYRGDDDDDDRDRRGRWNPHRHQYRAQSSSILGRADQLYLHAGPHKGCETYFTGWKPTGPQIDGILAIDRDEDDHVTDVNYFASACLVPFALPKSLATSAVSMIDFDPHIAIYQDRIFQLAASSPPDVSSLETNVAYCHQTDMAKATNGADIGLDVRIYQKGQELRGVINFGKQDGEDAIRFAVPPFAVEQSTSRTQISFVTLGFRLDVDVSGALPTTGSLIVALDGQQLDLAMKCWY